MINNYTISKDNLEHFISKVRELFDGENQFYLAHIIERKSKRSIDQNSRYWKLLTELGRKLGYSSDEMHDLMRFKFLRSKIEIEGEAMPLLKSTTKLNVAEMAAYQQDIEIWGHTLGFYFEES